MSQYYIPNRGWVEIDESVNHARHSPKIDRVDIQLESRAREASDIIESKIKGLIDCYNKTVSKTLKEKSYTDLENLESLANFTTKYLTQYN